jgi:hypothetical protein
MVVIAWSVWPTVAADQSQVEAVVQYAIPHYNGMYPGTEIVLSVVVDTSGAVVSSKYLSANLPVPMLITWASNAVEEWRFEEATYPNRRGFEVHFRFESAVSTDSLGVVQTTLAPPLTMRVVCNVPNVAMLERIKGQVPQETCSLHGVQMDVSVVPSRYPCPSFGHREYSTNEIRQMNRYEKVMNRLFPNAPTNALVDRQAAIDGEGKDGCASFAEIYYCSRCFEARFAWCKKHATFCSEWSGSL